VSFVLIIVVNAFYNIGIEHRKSICSLAWNPCLPAGREPGNSVWNYTERLFLEYVASPGIPACRQAGNRGIQFGIILKGYF